MTSRPIDRIEKFAARHARAISILAGIWFWLGVAITARFIRLPDLGWPLAEAVVFWSGVLVNALWWGFVRPAVERRRRARLAQEG